MEEYQMNILLLQKRLKRTLAKDLDWKILMKQERRNKPKSINELKAQKGLYDFKSYWKLFYYSFCDYWMFLNFSFYFFGWYSHRNYEFYKIKICAITAAT